ncbi:MAG: IS66 family transposase [Candidatus Melainabacteria bacterium]|jgi:transposase|nr:IS66 family transposase [Candidatus Melainabacteria bacterium]
MSALKRRLPRAKSKEKSRHRPAAADKRGNASGARLTEVAEKYLRSRGQQKEEACNQRCAASKYWQKRFFSREKSAQELEGRLSLRDKEIAQLKEDLAQKNAHVLKLERILYASGPEKQPVKENTSDENAQANESHTFQAAKPKRNRGGQPGSNGAGRRGHDHLPVDGEQTFEIPESCCLDCGEQWQEGAERGYEQVEISVRAYRRKIRRKNYGHFCKAKGRWVSKTASAPRPLFPHSTYGISVWVFLLVGKFVLQMAANRVRLLLKSHDLDIPSGTIAAGFKRIHKLIKVLVQEIRRYSRDEKHHWHLDDTGWKVFVRQDEKEGFGWYLWVFLSKDVCVYILNPSRAREVPKSHLEQSVGVVTSDRLQANKKLGDNIKHSFCWVHERRDLRDLARAYPLIADLCNFFLELIGNLFHFNAERLLNEPGTKEFEVAQKKLKDTLDSILENCQKELAKPDTHAQLRRVLTGIVKDWDGFYMFFDLPAVPPDNNPAERALRGPVVGRKNYYGCGSEWSAEFTADMFTLCQTLKLNNIEPQKFLTEYLQACADNNGKPPANVARFMPWNRPPPQN